MRPTRSIGVAAALSRQSARSIRRDRRQQHVPNRAIEVIEQELVAFGDDAPRSLERRLTALPLDNGTRVVVGAVRTMLIGGLDNVLFEERGRAGRWSNDLARDRSAFLDAARCHRTRRTGTSWSGRHG